MESKRQKRILTGVGLFYSWTPVIVWMTVIFVLSTRQRLVVSDEYLWNFIFFKTLHVVEYSILFLLSLRALHRTYSLKPIHYFMAFLLTIIYAGSDELHQSFVPTREGTIRDVIIDGIGALIAWIFLYTVLPKMPKKLKKLVKSLGLPI